MISILGILQSEMHMHVVATLHSTGLCRALLGACRYLLFAACAAVDSDSHGHRSQSILFATYCKDNSDKEVKIMFDIYVH